MAEIKLEMIAKSFGQTPVLKGIDLDIRDGEFISLVGPSGCGKSTLLRIVAGLEQQSSGHVLIGEKKRRRDAVARSRSLPWSSSPMRFIRISRSRRISLFR